MALRPSRGVLGPVAVRPGANGSAPGRPAAARAAPHPIGGRSRRGPRRRVAARSPTVAENPAPPCPGGRSLGRSGRASTVLGPLGGPLGLARGSAAGRPAGRRPVAALGTGSISRVAGVGLREPGGGSTSSRTSSAISAVRSPSSGNGVRTAAAASASSASSCPRSSGSVTSARAWCSARTVSIRVRQRGPALVEHVPADLQRGRRRVGGASLPPELLGALEQLQLLVDRGHGDLRAGHPALLGGAATGAPGPEPAGRPGRGSPRSTARSGRSCRRRCPPPRAPPGCADGRGARAPGAGRAPTVNRADQPGQNPLFRSDTRSARRAHSGSAVPPDRSGRSRPRPAAAAAAASHCCSA